MLFEFLIDHRLINWYKALILTDHRVITGIKTLVFGFFRVLIEQELFIGKQDLILKNILVKKTNPVYRSPLFLSQILCHRRSSLLQAVLGSK